MRRRKTSNGTGRPTSSQHRASFPMVRPQLSESKAAARLEQTLQPSMPYENGDNSSSERIDGTLVLLLQVRSSCNYLCTLITFICREIVCNTTQ